MSLLFALLPVLFCFASVADEKTETELCVGSTPCGWAVYSKYNREVEYFLKNRCDCESGTSCKKHSDDLASYAFIYRCLPEEEQH